MKKLLIAIGIVLGIAGGFFIVRALFDGKTLSLWSIAELAVGGEEKVTLRGVVVDSDDTEKGKGTEKIKDQPQVDSELANKDILNILLVGTDTSTGRRSRGQGGFNTDVMILVSVNPETNKVLLTSVPRDLWINGNKINALHVVYGYETLRDAFEKVTGQEVDGYIRADFDHFMWLVDAFDGVPVEVQRDFVDSSFPRNNDSGPQTVSFKAGLEVMDGDRALTFARSRKGTNGEGSDLMRARRQHLILQGMIKAISQPESTFWPMDVETFYNAVTAKMATDLSIGDVYYLWDFYKDRDLYEIESLVVDGAYVYHPGMYPDSQYHAWVFVARNNSFWQLHKDIEAKLDGTFVDPNAVEETSPNSAVAGTEPAE